jgi:hypothetical protein
VWLNETTLLTVTVVLGIGYVSPLIKRSEEPVSSCTEYSAQVELNPRIVSSLLKRLTNISHSNLYEELVEYLTDGMSIEPTFARYIKSCTELVQEH